MKNRMMALLFVSVLLLLFLTACSDLTKVKPKANVDSEQTIKKERETNSVLTNGNVPVKQNSLPANKKVMNAKVIKNVDGDTVVINLNGKDEKVR
ncbi:MAG: hypothetical protein Q8906_08340, partial [Bacillota bacterium]|nr:hypothetical protein [Bacillota bacterium]